MSTTSAGSKHRYLYLDSLRAIAAFAVVWMHVSEVFCRAFKEVAAHGTGLYDFAYLVDLGRVGVTCFFIISGFVVPTSLRGERTEGIRKFLVRRFWRLYPAYWVAVILGYISVRWLFNNPLSKISILANFTMIQEFLGATSVMGHFWTLETEIGFYILCCVLFFLGWTRNFRVISVLVVTFGVLFRLYSKSKHGSFWLHLSLMLWGTLFRLWDEDGRRIRSSRFLALVVTAFAFLQFDYIWMGLKWGNDGWIRHGLGYSIGFFCFVLGATWLKLESRWLAYLGEISYSIYLFHPVVFYTAFYFMVKPEAPAALRAQPLFAYIAFFSVATVPVAMLVYHCVEKPAIRLSQRLTSKSEA